jgi:hypothetical protein
VDGSAEMRGLGEDEEDEDERARNFSGPSKEAMDKFQQCGEPILPYVR